MFENPEQAFGGTKPMLDLIEAIYATAPQQTLWVDVLDRISTAIEGGSITPFALAAIGLKADGQLPVVFRNFVCIGGCNQRGRGGKRGLGVDGIGGETPSEQREGKTEQDRQLEHNNDLQGSGTCLPLKSVTNLSHCQRSAHLPYGGYVEYFPFRFRVVRDPPRAVPYPISQATL